MMEARISSVVPTIHIVSDSVGLTAQAVARAAASQFGDSNPHVEVFPKVRDFEDIRAFFEKHLMLNEKEYGEARMLVFYTLVDRSLNAKLKAYLVDHPEITAVDVMCGTIEAIAEYSGLEPFDKPGVLHVTDEQYFARIAALEFTLSHDDGRNPQDLTKAEIVLVGVSRSSKTPLSIYLAQEGYKVANVPLDYRTAPPKELFDVEPTRIFGLTTQPELLSDIRKRRLGAALTVASDYADPEKVHHDLEEARALMRKLGCIVVHTDNKAVEEAAQEILRYYELAHP